MKAEVRVAACGALGGATNAWLCYAEVPVAAAQNTTFGWHVIPAGAVHGSVLAFTAFGGARLLASRGLRLRLLVAAPLAWVAGVASWIPLNRSAFDEPWLKSLTWPFHDGWGTALLAPFQYFGFVAGLYYLSLVIRVTQGRSLAAHVLTAGASGTLGSLWWWIAMESWYFSPLHGTIWGAFVGAGAWAWAASRGRDMEKSVV